MQTSGQHLLISEARLERQVVDNQMVSRRGEGIPASQCLTVRWNLHENCEQAGIIVYYRKH